MYRELLVKFHIEDIINLIGEDGEMYAHIVVKVVDGVRLKDSLLPDAVIFDTDTDTLSELDVKYKNSKGNLKHNYLGRPGFERVPSRVVDLRGGGRGG